MALQDLHTLPQVHLEDPLNHLQDHTWGEEGEGKELHYLQYPEVQVAMDWVFYHHLLPLHLGILDLGYLEEMMETWVISHHYAPLLLHLLASFHHNSTDITWVTT